MGLATYKKKRDFRQTSEPAGKERASKGRLSFVVQRHKASRLHYDFRLEMEGVLKSWAVPKGPSLDPQDKRLAMMVEDHPYDYKDFAGVIPEGNYGAGIVEIWDKGTYVHETAAGKGEERALLQDLRKGSLKFTLHGRKLKGSFALVRLKSAKDENAWLLIKHRDRYAEAGYNSEEHTGRDRRSIARWPARRAPSPAPGSDEHLCALHPPDALRNRRQALRRPGLDLRDQVGWLPCHRRAGRWKAEVLLTQRDLARRKVSAHRRAIAEDEA